MTVSARNVDTSVVLAGETLHAEACATKKARRDESRRGTQECVRYG
jgi:hypothetical protein